MKNDLIIIGDIAWENTIIRNAGYTSIGGAGFYTTIGCLAAEFNNVVLVSSVGADSIVNKLTSLNINTEGIKIVHHAKTAQFTTRFGLDGFRTFEAKYGALDYPNLPALKKYVNSSIVYLAGSLPSKQLSWINKLKQIGFSGIIASDVFELYCLKHKSETLKVLEMSDFCFMNNHEYHMLGLSLPKDKTIIVKKGAQGATYMHNGTVFSATPNESVIAVDTNGAGDVFAGVFLANIIAGQSYLTSLQLAVNVATQSVTKQGVLHILGVKNV